MTLMTLSIIKQKREKHSEKPGIVPCVRDADGLVVALCVGYSDEELQKLCKKHQGWYLSYFRE